MSKLARSPGICVRPRWEQSTSCPAHVHAQGHLIPFKSSIVPVILPRPKLPIPVPCEAPPPSTDNISKSPQAQTTEPQLTPSRRSDQAGVMARAIARTLRLMSLTARFGPSRSLAMLPTRLLGRILSGFCWAKQGGSPPANWPTLMPA